MSRISRLQRGTVSFGGRCLGLSLAVLACNALADDLRSAERFLCSTLQATVCFADGECGIVLPEDLNIPQFIIVDTKAAKLQTTAASGANRETRTDAVRRADGHVVMQGFEGGRAFSLMIREENGQAAFASVADDRSVIVFAACTPASGP